MILYMIFGVFAAIGFLFMLWLLAGAFLPGCRQGSAYVRCDDKDLHAVLRRYRWMRDLGLTRFDLIVLDCGLDAPAKDSILQTFPGVTFSSTEEG